VSFALIATHLLSAGIINRCDKTPINNSQQTHTHTHTHTYIQMNSLWWLNCRMLAMIQNTHHWALEVEL